MKYLKLALLSTVLMMVGIGFSTLAMASQHGKSHHMQEGGHHCKHHGGGWKATLTDVQRK